MKTYTQEQVLNILRWVDNESITRLHTSVHLEALKFVGEGLLPPLIINVSSKDSDAYKEKIKEIQKNRNVQFQGYEPDLTEYLGQRVEIVEHMKQRYLNKWGGLWSKDNTPLDNI
jgi:hypothetical protein